MKRIFIVIAVMVLMVILVVPVTSQNNENKNQSLTQMVTGYTWSQMDDNSQTFYLAGYISSMRFTKAFVAFLEQDGVFTTNEIVKFKKYIYEWTDYHYQIGYLMEKITEYYNETGNWDTPLARAVLIVTKNRATQILNRIEKREEKKESNDGKDEA